MPKHDSGAPDFFFFQNLNLPKHISKFPIRMVWAKTTNIEHYIIYQKYLSKYNQKYINILLKYFLIPNVPKHIKILFYKYTKRYQDIIY